MRVNPYVHYLTYGKHEQRLPRPVEIVAASVEVPKPNIPAEAKPVDTKPDVPVVKPSKIWQVRDRVSHIIRGAVYNRYPNFTHEDAFVAPNWSVPQPQYPRGNEAHFQQLHDNAMQSFDESYDANKLNEAYLLLSDEYSQEMFLHVIVGRVLKARKFRLPIYYSHVWNTFDKVLGCQVGDVSFMRGVVAQYQYNLRAIGYDITLFSSPIGIFSMYVLEQYRYRNLVMAEPGDIIIDGGAFMGETSLYFGHKMSYTGHIYAFEFIPENVSVMRSVLETNTNYRDVVTVVERPLWRDSNTIITTKDDGPASQVVESQDSEQQQFTTISIDDFAKNTQLEKIDYIKLDIEGAEMAALEGARHIITTHRPKIAVCLYHKDSDFWQIPQLLHEMVPEYEFYVDSFIAFPPWETVLFARVRS
jgi:FkbM family methyltransferase